MGYDTRFEGFLDQFNLRKHQAEDMIMRARVKAGWISEEDLITPEEPEEAAEPAEEPSISSALEEAEAVFAERPEKSPEKTNDNETQDVSEEEAEPKS